MFSACYACIYGGKLGQTQNAPWWFFLPFPPIIPPCSTLVPFPFAKRVLPSFKFSFCPFLSFFPHPSASLPLLFPLQKIFLVLILLLVYISDFSCKRNLNLFCDRVVVHCIPRFLFLSICCWADRLFPRFSYYGCVAINMTWYPETWWLHLFGEDNYKKGPIFTAFVII